MGIEYYCQEYSEVTLSISVNRLMVGEPPLDEMVSYILSFKHHAIFPIQYP